MSDKESHMFDPKDRKILYEFWDNLPKMKIVVNYDDNFFSHAIRKFIFGILGTGIKEEIDGKEIVRKALNVQEILQIIEEIREHKKEKLIEKGKDFEPSLHSLYFHLQKLEEAGFIRTVAILREGKHNVTYYSRSAQTVFFKENYAEDENTRNAFLAIAKVIPQINPKLNPEKVMEFYERYVNLAKERLENVQKKISEYQDQMNLEKIDPNDLQKFFMLINGASPKFVSLYKEMIEYLGINIWN